MDIISKLPVGIIETILCFLPIQEAARTSILSREWRYHWIKIPKLAFNVDTVQVSTDEDELSILEQMYGKPTEKKDLVKLFNAIYQVLLVHEGPILEFTLRMNVDDSCVEIDNILLHLSKKNTVERIKLDLYAHGRRGYMLPMSLFSLHQLTDMYLSNCSLFHERSFNEFGRLTTLNLHGLWTNADTLLRLLSSCPLLKRLTIYSASAYIYPIGNSTIVDLFKCCPVIEYLYVSLDIVMYYDSDRIPKELPTTLVHLKYLCLDVMCFTHKYGLPLLGLLIRSSPNLEKLRLELYPEFWSEEDLNGSSTVKDCSDIMLEHLNDLEIINFSDSDNELDFLKLILAKSPVLKKVRIEFFDRFNKDEELHISKLLLNIPCASLVVKKLIVRRSISN